MIDEGATLDDDTLALVFDDYPLTAIESPDPRRHRLFFVDSDERDAALIALTHRFASAARVTAVDVEDDGWATKVQAALQAVRVGGLVIAPPWDVAHALEIASSRGVEAADSSPARLIVIEPSTGFGTGHHQSTRLCLRALQRLDLRDRAVIDVGTGSGVLAIAAAVLGATTIVAVDNDADALEAARRNMDLNAVAGRVTLQQAGLADYSAPPADVVVANLTVSILTRFVGTLTELVAPDALLVVGGFTSDQVSLVLDAFSGWTAVARDDEDDWVGLTLRRPLIDR